MFWKEKKLQHKLFYQEDIFPLYFFLKGLNSDIANSEKQKKQDVCMNLFISPIFISKTTFIQKEEEKEWRKEEK